MLDVQDLRRQIDELARARDLMQWRALVVRHTPDGSLYRTVSEFYRLFRCGYCLESRALAALRRIEAAWRQRTFLERVMTTDVDVGGGFAGRELLLDQMRVYAASLRGFRLDLRGFDILPTDDAVLITTRGALQFDVTRATLELVFPHVLGREQLVARLVGRRVTTEMRVTFCFDEHGQCMQYSVDVDYFGVFAALLCDPRDVELLMARALITPNSMLGVEDSHSSASSHKLLTDGEDGST